MGHIAALTLSHITTHSITAAEQQYCIISVVVVWCLVMAQLAACGAASPLCRGSAAVSSDWDTTGLHQPEPGHSVQGWAMPSLGCMSTWPLVTGHRALPPHWTWQIIQRAVKRFHSCGTMCPDRGTMHGSVNYLYLDCNQIKIHEDKVVSYGHCCDMWVV